MARLKKNNFTNLRRLSNEFDKIVLDCSYAQKDCTNENVYTPFTLKGAVQRYSIGMFFTLHELRAKASSFYTKLSFPVHNSIVSGLELILDPQLDEYLPISTEVGFVVMIHGHGFRENVVSDSDFVEPGYVTYIGLHLNKRTGLPEPYQKPCRSDYPRHLRKWVRNMTKYTKEECLSLCEQNINRERCRCESRSLPSSRRETSPVSYGICAGIPEKEKCVNETRALMDEPTTESYCKCYWSCTDLDYYKEVSRSALSDVSQTRIEFKSNI
ncbi:unnamed protein product [Ixodes pacificus]